MKRRTSLQRRQLLAAGGAAAGSMLAGCGAPCEAMPRLASAVSAQQPKPGIQAICFDVFTLFDPRSVQRVLRDVAPEQADALWGAWRSRQFEYSWLRASAGRYVDFEVVTEEALEFAARDTGVSFREAQIRRLVAACSELEPWPDAYDALARWRREGLLLAPLSNYSPAMLARLIARAGLTGLFTTLVSTDAARTFKPDPRAYALGSSALGLPPASIAFAAFGGWDAAGARWFGFRSFWVNRLQVTAEALAPGPEAAGATFADLDAFIRR